jgi:hypothetical protein
MCPLLVLEVFVDSCRNMLSGFRCIWSSLQGAHQIRAYDISTALIGLPRCDQFLKMAEKSCTCRYDTRRKSSVAQVPIAKMGYSEQMHHYPTCAARSLSSKGCLLSVGLSTGGAIMFLDKRKLSSCVHPGMLVDADGTRHSKAGLKRGISAIASCSGMPTPQPPLELSRLFKFNTIFAGTASVISRCAIACTSGAAR